MNGVGTGTVRSELEAVEIHDVLSNERRRHILEFLHEGGSPKTARELSEQIAQAETGEVPPPTNIRQSVYVSLHQTHLPKLDELGIVRYDRDGKTVALDQRAADVGVYLETVPKYGLAWSEYYLGVSVLGLLVIIAGEIGVPILAEIGSLPLAVATFVLILASALYQTVAQRSSILHRLGGDVVE